MKQVVINPLSNRCVDCFTSLGKFGKFQEILMNVLNMWPSDLFKRDSSILDNYYHLFALCDHTVERDMIEKSILLKCMYHVCLI